MNRATLDEECREDTREGKKMKIYKLEKRNEIGQAKAGDPNLWYAKTLLNNIPIDKRALIRWSQKKYPHQVVHG